jgi:SnoaL-like domain
MKIQIEDRLAIHELLTRLYLALDRHNPGGFASFFTADGVFCAIYGEYKGRQAIAGFIAEHIKKGNEDHARHLLTNLAVEESEGSPIVHCYVTKIRLEPPPITIIAYAGLQAKVVKEQADWRIGRLDLSITLTPA